MTQFAPNKSHCVLVDTHRTVYPNCQPNRSQTNCHIGQHFQFFFFSLVSIYFFVCIKICVLGFKKKKQINNRTYLKRRESGSKKKRV